MPSSVDVGSKLEAFVAKLVESGRYNSKSEVLREGLRLLHERELGWLLLKQRLLAALRTLMPVG